MSGFGSVCPELPDWAWLRGSGNVLLRAGCDLTDARGLWGVGFVAVDYVALVVDDFGGVDRMRSFHLETRIARLQRLLAIEGVATVSAAQIRAAMVNADAEGLLDPLDANFWAAFEEQVRAGTRGVIVPAFEGWEASPVVWHSVCWALGGTRPVYLLADERGVANG
jgi:hypothetical protein